MENREVAWAMTMPLPLRGGPNSETQKALREGRYQEPDQTVIVATDKAAMPMSMSPDKLQCVHAAKCGGNIEMCKGGDVMKQYCKGGRVELRGGGDVHSSKFDRCVKHLQAKGSPAPGAICMKSIGYEGSVNAGHRNKPGYQAGGETKFDNTFGGGTGQSDGNIIQSDKVVNTKSFDDHEGEYYASAPLTQILGGGKEVENILLNEARKRIRAKIQPSKSATPIMNKADVAVAAAPGSVSRPGYAFGGLTSVVDTIKDKASQFGSYLKDAFTPEPPAPAPDMSYLANANPALPAPPPAPAMPTLTQPQAPDMSYLSNISTATPAAPAPVMPTITPADVAAGDAAAQAKGFKTQADLLASNGVSATAYYNGIAHKAARAAGFNSSSDYEKAKAAGQTSQEYYGAQVVRPELSAALDLMKGRRTLTAQETQFLNTANKAQLADFLVAEGAITPEQALKTKTAYFAANPTAAGAAEFTASGGVAGAPATRYDAQVQAGLRTLADYAAGKNPLMDSIINETMQQYGSDTAGGLEALKMDLAGKGITGPAADAILASYDRNARIGENKLRGDFAQKVMEEAKAASKELLDQVTGLQDKDRALAINAEIRAYNRATDTEEKAYNRLQAATALDRKSKTEAMAAAFEAPDVKLGAALYKQLYGVDLDTSNITAAVGSKAVAKATTDILAALNMDAGMTLDPSDTLGQQYLLPAVTALWNAQHPGQPLDMTWANKFITDFKTKNSDVYKMTTKYSQADATSLFFGGDPTYLDESPNNPHPENLFVNESTGEKGYKGFQSALASMFGTAITKGTDGNLVFNVELIMKHFEAPKLGYQAAPGGAVATPGQSIEIGGEDYSVVAKNADGSYTAMKDGKTYTLQPGASGTTWNEPTEKIETGLGVAQYRLDATGNPVPLTGTAEDAAYQPVTWKGQQLKVTIDGEDVNVYKRVDPTTGAISYHTDPAGGDADVGVTISATGEAKIVAYAPAAIGKTVMINGVPAEATSLGGTGKLTALSNVGTGQIVKDSSVPPRIFFLAPAAGNNTPTPQKVNLTQFGTAYDAATTPEEKSALIAGMTTEYANDQTTLAAISDKLGFGNYNYAIAPASSVFDTEASDEAGNRWNIVGDTSKVDTATLIKWAAHTFPTSEYSISTTEEDNLQKAAIAELDIRAGIRDSIKALSSTYGAETIKLLLKGVGGDFVYTVSTPATTIRPLITRNRGTIS